MERPKNKLIGAKDTTRVYFNWHQFADELEEYADYLEERLYRNEYGVFNQIQDEIERSNKLHGEMPDDIFVQLAIMQEEAGEVTKAVLDYKYHNASFDNIRTELVQTAAICVIMLNKLNK